MRSECLPQLMCRSPEGSMASHPRGSHDGRGLADRQPEDAYEHNSLALLLRQLPKRPSQIHSQTHLGFGQFRGPLP